MEVIDVHVHPLPDVVSKEYLLNAMDKNNIKKMILLAIDIGPSDLKNGKLEKNIYNAFRFTSIGNISKLVVDARKFIEFAETPNEHVYSYIRGNKDKFVGFGSVSPYRDTIEIENIFRKFDEYGFKGIKIIPTLQQFDPGKREKIEPIVKLAADRGYAIIAHTGFDPGPWEYFPLSVIARPSRYETLISNYDYPIILAHAGSYSAYYPGLWHQEALELANKFENVYLDISAVFYLSRDKNIVDKWRDYSLLDKILFGSDYPAVDGLTLEDSINLVKTSPILDEFEKKLILSRNAEKILKILKA